MKEVLYRHQTITRLVTAFFIVIAVCAVSSSLSFAQDEPANPTALLKDATSWFGEVMQFVLVVITILSFVVAAWAAIQVVSRLISGKGEIGGVLMTLVVAVFLTIFVGQMTFMGSEKIDELTTEGG